MIQLTELVYFTLLSPKQSPSSITTATNKINPHKNYSEPKIFQTKSCQANQNKILKTVKYCQYKADSTGLSYKILTLIQN